MCGLILLAALSIAAVTDALSGEIPVWLFPYTLFLNIFWRLLTDTRITADNFAGGIAFMIPILVLCLMGKMGGGDLIMFTVTGFLLGIYLLPAYVFWIGFTAAVQVVLTKAACLARGIKEDISHKEVPLAPLALAAYIILIIRGYVCIL